MQCHGARFVGRVIPAKPIGQCVATIVSTELELVTSWPTFGRDFDAVANQRPTTAATSDLSSKLQAGVPVASTHYQFVATIVSTELGLVTSWPTVGLDFDEVANQRPTTAATSDLSSKLKAGVARVNI